MNNKILNRLTVTAALITVTGGLYGFVSYLYMHLEGGALFAVLSVLFGLSSWLLLSGYKASRSFRSREPLPWPSWLWPLLFDRLPAVSGLIIDPTQKTRIAVIFDESSKELAEQLHGSYVDEHVAIEEFDCFESDAHARKDELLQVLSGIDAVYLIWTRSLKDAGWVSDTIIEWALQNSFKPILVVNRLPEEPYELPYVSLPEDKATSGLWRLLARSSERGRLWRLRASSNRRAFLISGALLVTAIAIASIFYLRDRERQQELESLTRANIAEVQKLDKKEIEAVSLQRHFVDELWNTTESTKTLLEQLSDEHLKAGKKADAQLAVQTTLNGWADFLEASLESSSESFGTVGSVTFWRITSFTDDSSASLGEVRTCVCEVAWSDGEKQTCFTYDEESIIGCAFKHNVIVLYQSGQSPQTGTLGAWSHDGRPVAYWKGGNFLVSADDSFECFYDNSENTEHDNLLCLAAGPRGANTVHSGLCTETVLESPLLKDPATRQFLTSALTPLHLIPDSLLTSEEAVNKCKAKWDAKIEKRGG